MSFHTPSAVPEPGPVERIARTIATITFGLLIVGAIGYEAIEAAGDFGWIAYPLVLGAGFGAFLLSRVAWRVTTGFMEAELEREALDAE